MIPVGFEYVRPASLDEALGHLANDGGTKVLAGGQSIIPLMKLRLARPPRLVDIGRLGELRGVRRTADGGYAVGAMTTYTEMLDSPLTELSLLADALPTIGDVQVRNRGTIGGAVAHADPASDLPACLLALEAEVVARSRTGERVIPIEELLAGAFATTLRPDEILTEVRLPAPGSAGSAYLSLEQKASGYAIVGVAAVVTAGGEARVGITGVADAAYRARGVEQGYAQGAAAAAEHAVDGVTTNGDIHADAEYRSAMAKVYTRRALEAAAGRLG
jgi:carbon-monoxide dehydrogenase medium subunit